MRVLLDTCALSEVRKPDPHPGVVQAVSELSDEQLFISVVTWSYTNFWPTCMSPGGCSLLRP